MYCFLCFFPCIIFVFVSSIYTYYRRKNYSARKNQNHQNHKSHLDLMYLFRIGITEIFKSYSPLINLTVSLFLILYLHSSKYTSGQPFLSIFMIESIILPLCKSVTCSFFQNFIAPKDYINNTIKCFYFSSCVFLIINKFTMKYI